MKYPILTKDTVDKKLSEMWNRTMEIPEEDPTKLEQVENATKIEQSLRAQLATEEKAVSLLWTAANVINPDNPLVAAASIAANAERLMTVLKSYQPVT